MFCRLCLSSAQFSKVEEVCPTDADDDTNIIRDPSKCGEVCIPDKCERELSKALLCVAGSPLVFDSDLNTGIGGSMSILARTSRRSLALQLNNKLK